MDTSPIAHVPHLDGVVEAPRDDTLAVSVKVQADNLRSVAQQCVQAVPRLDIPQARSVIHTTRGDHCAVRVERQANDLGGVAAVRVVQLPCLCIPQLARLVKRSRDDLVTVRVVECYCVHDVSVAFERQQLVPSYGVPHLACPIVASGDELIA